MSAPHTMPRPLHRRGYRNAAWADTIERRSRTPDEALIETARHNTERIGNDLPFLTMLAREIVATRAPELVRAYRELVWMLPGFKKTGSPGQTVVSSQPCVVLVVRKKKALETLKQENVLPASFLIYAEHAGVRQPFLVPTDVQDATTYSRARAQGAGSIWAARNGDRNELGNFCCLVRRIEHNHSELCLLSALHVLSPDNQFDASDAAGDRIMPVASGGITAPYPVLATTIDCKGGLYYHEDPARPSLDAQLARVEPESEAVVRERSPIRRFNKRLHYARNLDELLELGTSFVMLPPENNHRHAGRTTIHLQLSGLPNDTVSVPYTFYVDGEEDFRQVYHAELLRFDGEDAFKFPIRGDSGSPIVFLHDDGTMTLVAMHIGGDEVSASWAIPAWCLFDTARWARFPRGSHIVPESA